MLLPVLDSYHIGRYSFVEDTYYQENILNRRSEEYIWYRYVYKYKFSSGLLKFLKLTSNHVCGEIAVPIKFINVTRCDDGHLYAELENKELAKLWNYKPSDTTMKLKETSVFVYSSVLNSEKLCYKECNFFNKAVEAVEHMNRFLDECYLLIKIYKKYYYQ